MTFEPLLDADMVKIYKEADAICIGKTQIPAGNPFNRAYKTGGSSGESDYQYSVGVNYNTFWLLREAARETTPIAAPGLCHATCPNCAILQPV